MTPQLIKTREPPMAPASYSPDRHPALTYLARLAAGSRPAQRAALDRIANLIGTCDHLNLPWHLLRYQHTAALRSLLAEQLAPATANRYLSALRGVLKECWRLEYVDAETYRRAADLNAVRGSSMPAGRCLSPHELELLLGACAGAAPLDVRDHAMITVLAGCGLRRAELVGLDLSDWSPSSSTLRVRRGKGRREGVVPCNDSVTSALSRWIDVRGRVPGPLFVPVTSTMSRLSGQAVRHVLVRRAAAAGIAPVSPHDMRRTFISSLLDAGVDLSTAQRLARHADIQTTARYDRRDERAQRAAVERLVR